MRGSKHFLMIAVLAAACGESPTTLPMDAALVKDVVVTEGLPKPPATRLSTRPMFSDVSDVTASAGGSSVTPVTLLPQSCGEPQEIEITYTVTGRQANPASFKINSVWEYDGSAFAGSDPVTVNVPARAQGDPASTHKATITVENASSTSSGTANFTIVPFDLVTSPQATLDVDDADITIYVEFEPCGTENTAPVLTLPADMTVEATSSSGAVVNFVVLATDAEDADLDGSDVICTPATGSTFPLGETTVNCSVTDSGGLTAEGSFKITVVDTTPAYFTNFPAGTVALIAADIDGAVLDISTLGITVEDVGNVSEPATYACDYVAGTVLALGSTTTVSCTASDAIGNESAASSFDVFVTLDLSGLSGFLTPLRMQAPYSSHKRGSTIPHKFPAPAYADGTPATDLADGLRLVFKYAGNGGSVDDIEANDFSAGSTVWRWDDVAEHYIFNAKTQTNWADGTWVTTVSYAGIPLASTTFILKK